MLLQRKYIKPGLLLNIFIWFVFFGIPYIIKGDPFQVFLEDIFGSADFLSNIKTVGLLFLISLPLSMVIIAMLDFLFGIINPDQWVTMKLIEKHNVHYDNMDIRSGIPKSGNSYSFVFLDKKGKKRRYEGSASQYAAMKQGAMVRVRVKASMLIEVDTKHKS